MQESRGDSICQRADVGRSTFYMHFQGKEDLLDGGLGDLKEGLRRLAALRAVEAPVLPFARGLIEHVDEQRRLFRALIGKRSGHVVQTRFRAMVQELVAECLPPRSGEDWQRDAASHYLASAIMQLLVWWIDKGSSVSAQALERQMIALSAGAMAALEA